MVVACTVDRPALMRYMHPVHVPRKIPVVLSPDEVARLIGSAGNLKNQTALSVAYGAGLRVSEVATLKVSPRGLSDACPERPAAS